MKPRFFLVNYPVSRAFIVPFNNMCSIIEGFSDEKNVIISSNDTHGEQIRCGKNKHYHIISKNYHHLFLRVTNYIWTEIKISSLLFKLSKPNDIVIYFIQNFPILPMISSKILRMQVIWLLPSSVKISKWNSRTDPLSVFPVLFQNIGYSISDILVIYSPLLIRDWNLGKYNRKIKIAHEHFIDFHAFQMTTLFSERPNIVAYIGRMNYEKGFENFLDALPILLKSDKNVKILIGGDGPLKDAIKAKLDQSLTSRVDIIGWISHDDLPGYLNQLRLLVLPSYTEGLPNTMLESMACGTPVLATPVGAVPGIIRDGVTGFTMENNSPQCISDNIIRALQDPNLGKIAIHAKEMVEKEFNFETTVMQWKQLFEKI